MKIFVSAYACEPDLGSEIGVGWHWVLEMSKRHELWVLTRESNRHSISAWLSEHSEYCGIHFIYYDLPKWARWWKKGMRGVRIYYNLWQKMTDRIVKKTMQENDIGIYHLLTYGNALWPASSYGMRQTFIWGPTGGVDTIPSEYTRYYGLRWRLTEWVRRLVVSALPLNAGFQRRCREADVILCKSYSMREAIAPKYRKKAVLMTDVAAEPSKVLQYTRKRQEDGKVHGLMVGRLDAWRGFDLAVEALATAVREHPEIHLDIVGDGSDRERLQRWVDRHGVGGHVTLHGKVPMERYYQMMADCDMVLNPALKEGAVTTAFDAMAFGRPLVCIDTGGYTRYFHDDFAVLIERRGRDRVVRDLADALVMLCDAETRMRMGKKAQEAAGLITWEKKGGEIEDVLLGLRAEGLREGCGNAAAY